VTARLSPIALALTCAVLWGGSMLGAGVMNLIVPDFGIEFLRVMSSVYRGFEVPVGPRDVFIGALYGVVEGAIGGLLIAWLYNAMLSWVSPSAPTE
jgi:hypothetical protein